MVVLADFAAWLPLLAVGLGLFLGPGLALRGLLAAALPRGARLGAPDGALGALLDGLGLSLALWPLLLLYAHVVHLPFNTLTAGVVLAVSGAALGGSRWHSGGPGRCGPARGCGCWSSPDPADGQRDHPALHRGPLPARAQLGRLVHHTLITQLFLEQRGPQRLRALRAGLFLHLSLRVSRAGRAVGLADRSDRVVGGDQRGPDPQRLRCARGLCADAGAVSQPHGGAGSAVVVGYLSGTPTQYVNWGRYTQLAGQVLLPFALVWFMRLVEAPPAGWRANGPRLALAAIGAAGLGLTHYRILIFYALFVPVYLIAVMGACAAGAKGAWRRGGRWAGARGRGARGPAVRAVDGQPAGRLSAGAVQPPGARDDDYLDEYAAQAFPTIHWAGAARAGRAGRAAGAPGRAAPRAGYGAGRRCVDGAAGDLG